MSNIILSEKSGEAHGQGDDDTAELQRPEPRADAANEGYERPPKPKRKRKDAEDDIEGAYMQRLAKEEARGTSSQDDRHGKRRKIEDAISNPEESSITRTNDGDQNSAGDSDDESPPPQHETITPSTKPADLEKAARTVFLANVSTLAIKSKTSRRTLLDHLSSFLPLLAAHHPPHQIESLRFRSTAYTNSSGPKKAAFAKKDLMDATTKSTNGYVVYSTTLAAREATKRLNGTMILERHLRVDSVAHPAPTDHRRCVFVGNLGFVDDETMIRAANDNDGTVRPAKKGKEPADVEEGLWRQFLTAGAVESVRVVRDAATRVGKGFAYVQFQVCTNSVIHDSSVVG